MLTYLDRAGAWLARRFGHPVNTSAAFIMAIYTFVWGSWLTTPAWNVFNRAPLFNWLSSVAPESFWGIIAMTVGVLMTVGLIRQTYRALTLGLFIGFIHWSVISVGYFLGDWKNTGGITSAMIALYCAFVYLNLRMNKQFFLDSDILK